MKTLFVLLLCGSLVAACTRDRVTETDCLDSVVMWMGDPAADGLGWTLLKDSAGGMSVYIPRNLPDSLKIDGQPVHVCLFKTNENFYCECLAPMKKYHITSIRKR